MTKREQVIVTLLERYHELVDPMQSRAGVGDGEPLPLMPSTYTPSLRELERLLVRMRSERRSQWFHVTQRYLFCTRHGCERARRGGKWLTQPHESVVAAPQGWDLALVDERAKKARKASDPVQVTVVRWDANVRDERVRRGVEWLAEQWSLPLEPMIPKELLVAA